MKTTVNSVEFKTTKKEIKEAIQSDVRFDFGEVAIDEFIIQFFKMTNISLKKEPLLPYDYLVIGNRDCHDNSISENLFFIPRMNYYPEEEKIRIYDNSIGSKMFEIEDVLMLFEKVYVESGSFLFFDKYKKDPLRFGKKTKKKWRAKAQTIRSKQKGEILSVLY